MSETKIEWTDTTWNPVAGCSIMSSGCKNCYAMRMAYRLEAMGVLKYKGLTQKINGNIVWRGSVIEDYKSLNIPLKWKKRRNVFVNSMSDLFHENVKDSFIEKVWRVMEKASWHNFQILTKRPDRMSKILQGSPVLENVWVGTSVENKDAVERIEYLKNTPAKIRFISFEPLIGSVGEVNLDNIDWAIIGGESGYNARPIKEQWIDEIYKQCESYDTEFFFKQWGAWGADNKKRSKKANGREYRGREWNNMPKMMEAGIHAT